MSFVVPNGWELANLVCKLAIYLGTVSIAGGAFCLWLSHDKSRRFVRIILRYILTMSVLAVNAVILLFLVQVGGINDDGITGMLDWTMISFIYGTGSGDVAVLRAMGFATAIVTCIVALRHVAGRTVAPGKRFYQRVGVVCSISLILVASGSRVVGHVSVLPLTAQVAIILHLVAISLWVGSLYPLWSLCQSQLVDELQSTLKKFGDLAVYIVSLIVFSGVLMLWQLLATPLELINTAYGLAMLLKILLVLALLLVAAMNKLVLVPRLALQQGSKQLKVSIQSEIILATLILILTSYLSTLVGPDHQMG